MKSSSELFPVALMKAEVVAERFVEDTYLLKPNNSHDKSVQIALTRLGFAEKEEKHSGKPVILVHGSFTNRGFWLSSRGKGLAAALLDAGFDPWMVELRGHGDSPANTDYKNNSILKYAKYDLPAVADFVKEQTEQIPCWVGHSLGGVTISTALASGDLTENQIEGLALFGAQVSRYPLALRLPVVRLIAKVLLSLRSKNIVSSKGPEQEPVGIAKEFVRWAGLFSGWRPLKGKSFWKTMNPRSLPLIAFGAQKDSGDPAKYCKKLAQAISKNPEYHLLSKKNGYTKDYGHVNMIISKEAEQEVWPKLIIWLKKLTKEGVNNDSIYNS